MIINSKFWQIPSRYRYSILILVPKVRLHFTTKYTLCKTNVTNSVQSVFRSWIGIINVDDTEYLVLSRYLNYNVLS